MDKNIFIKKYNPDVINKFSSRNDKLNVSNIEYKKEVWKGITGNEFLNNVKSADDFIIKFDKPDLNAINSKHNTELASRQKEINLIEEKNKKIKEAALQSFMNIDLISSNQEKKEVKTYNELKQIQVNDNDLLKEEKEKFNNLLKNLENII
jgi:hypothetical protein